MPASARFVTTADPPPVTTGAARLSQDVTLVGVERFGLLTNFTGTMPGLERNVDALLSAGLNVTALFGPEHGLRGSGQAGETEDANRDDATGLPLFETYLRSGPDLDELLDSSNVTALVFDMQDIGVRYYTYIWTMYDAMLSAARTGRRFVVLDRPNPMGGLVTAGPSLNPRFASFVGRVDVPLRTGLTAGELAGLFNDRHLPSTVGHHVDLQVVTMNGWERSSLFDDTGLCWVAPSPNMPTLDTVFAFCAMGLIEGTNVSEGRGTTRPFEYLGAPWVDGRLVEMLRELALPGVAFRDIWFTPSFHKYAGQAVRGVQLHITDRHLFDPVACGVFVVWAFATLYPDDFTFLATGAGRDPGELGHPIDRLWGSDSLRRTVAGGFDPLALLQVPGSPEGAYGASTLLY